MAHVHVPVRFYDIGEWNHAVDDRTHHAALGEAREISEVVLDDADAPRRRLGREPCPVGPDVLGHVELVIHRTAARYSSQVRWRRRSAIVGHVARVSALVSAWVKGTLGLGDGGMRDQGASRSTVHDPFSDRR